MRALLIATVAALGLGVLAGCGERSGPGAAGQTSTVTSVTSSADGKAPPVTPSPSVVVEPTPPGGKPQDPGANAGTPPVSMGPDGPVVPPGVTEVPAAQIDASALPEYYEQRGRVWVFDDGFSLQMFAAGSSGCTDAEAVVVDQSADSVKILLRPLSGPQGGRPDDSVCTAVMAPRPVVVQLDTPLRDRKILLSAGR